MSHGSLSQFTSYLNLIHLYMISFLYFHQLICTSTIEIEGWMVTPLQYYSFFPLECECVTLVRKIEVDPINFDQGL